MEPKSIVPCYLAVMRNCNDCHSGDLSVSWCAGNVAAKHVIPKRKKNDIENEENYNDVRPAQR